MANPNPAPHRRWKKGQSGNPTGKGSDPNRTASATMRALLLSRRWQGETLPDGKLVLDLVCERLVDLAVGGDLGAIKECFDRGFSKVPQAAPAPDPDAGEPRDYVIVLPPGIKGDGTDDLPPEGQGEVT
jgi:hypothetical protein